MKSVSFIVPTYNEKDNFVVCLHTLETFAKSRSIDYEIIVVDSGSTDGTRERLEEIAAEKESVRAVFQDTKMGMGSALREAYPYVRNDVVCHYECDMPFQTSEIDKALKLLDSGDCDFVLGNRTGSRDRWVRYLYTAGYRLFLRLFFGSRFQTINYSYKIFDSKLLNYISLRSSGWFIDAELVLEVLRSGYKILEIPVPYIEREKGNSTVRVLDILNILSEAGCYARGRWSFFSPSSS